MQPFVDCYWMHGFEAGKAEESPLQSCLPLGMVEIIVHITEDHSVAHINDSWLQLPQAYVVGLYKNTVVWKTKGATKIFGIRLMPESLLKLFKVPAATLFSSFTDIDSFFCSSIDEFTDKLRGCSSFAALVQLAEQFLQTKLKSLENGRNYVFEASNIIRQAQGNVTIENLSGKIYISRRQLERGFKEHFGITPKMYMRLIRFRNAYEFVQQNPAAVSWAEVTYNFGYADQAHFIRDFKEFVGEVPTAMRQKVHQFYQMAYS